MNAIEIKRLKDLGYRCGEVHTVREIQYWIFTSIDGVVSGISNVSNIQGYNITAYKDNPSVSIDGMIVSASIHLQNINIYGQHTIIEY